MASTVPPAPEDVDRVIQSQHHTRPIGQRHDRIQEPNMRDLAIASPEPDEPSDVSISSKMLSAVSGSILTSILVTPLDVVRVRLQSQSSVPPPSATAYTHTPSPFSNLPPNLGISSCCREVFWVTNNTPYCVASPNIALVNNPLSQSECAVQETQRKAFTSTLDGLRKIARHEGATTLWRGLSPTLVMAVPANVIYFAGYDWMRTSPASPFRNRISDAYAPLAAGSTARILAAVVVSPIEMFRTRMQASHGAATTSGHFMETLNGLRDMVASQGYRSLWRGLTLTLWRDVPFSALYWWGYESTRNALTDMREQKRGREKIRGTDALRLRSRSRSQEKHTATLVDSFVAGAASGAIAALVTTPFDVGKTRQQVIRHSADSATKNAATASLRPEEQSMPRFLLHIFREQGLPGLFKGWAARCLKVAPACAIMISSYEVGKRMAGAASDRRKAEAEE